MQYNYIAIVNNMIEAVFELGIFVLYCWFAAPYKRCPDLTSDPVYYP